MVESSNCDKYFMGVSVKGGQFKNISENTQIKEL